MRQNFILYRAGFLLDARFFLHSGLLLDGGGLAPGPGILSGLLRRELLRTSLGSSRLGAGLTGFVGLLEVKK